MGRFLNILRQFDHDVLGRYISIETAAYTSNPIVQNGKGAFTAEEWRRCRNDYPENAQVSPDKVGIAQHLCQAFPFSDYRSVLELGCGHMIQASVIVQAFPHLQYHATDFDETPLVMSKNNPLVSGIRKSVLNAAIDELPKADLVISFGLEYSLDRAELDSLFMKVHDNGADYLLVSASRTGPLSYARFRVMEMMGWQRARIHGWSRSAKRLTECAAKAGFRARDLGIVANAVCLWLSPNTSPRGRG